MSWMPTAIKHQRQTLIPLSSMWRTLPALSSTSPSSCSSPCSSSSSQIMQSFRFILWQRWAARVLRSFSTVQPGRTTTHGPLSLPGLSWLPWTVQLHFHPCPADAAGEKRPVPVRERWWWWCRWYLTYSGFVCQIFDLNHFPLGVNGCEVVDDQVGGKPRRVHLLLSHNKYMFLCVVSLTSTRNVLRRGFKGFGQTDLESEHIYWCDSRLQYWPTVMDTLRLSETEQQWGKKKETKILSKQQIHLGRDRERENMLILTLLRK